MGREVPPDWEVATFDKIVRKDRPICYGVLKPGAHVPSGVPLVRIVDLVDGKVRLDELHRISTELNGDFSRSRLDGGEILLSIQGTIGRVAVAPSELRGGNISRTIARIAIDQNSAEYVAQWMRSDAGQVAFDTAVVGTTRSSLNIGALRKVKIPLPPLAEQQKIAAIISSVDDAIAAARKVVEQTKRVKQGLLQTVMTRGLGHTRFKKTEIGEIPYEWEVVPLQSLLSPLKNAMRSGPFGSALLKKELVDEGVPLLGIDNIHEEEFRSHYTRFVSREKFIQLGRYAVKPRDVVITIMGTVGRTCVLPRDIGPALSSKHLWTMTFDQSRYLPELASLQLNYAPWVQRHFKSQSQGGIMKAIRSDVLRSTPLPLPPLEEQEAILDILEACHRSQATADRETVQLVRLRQGLMNDLLTGRVRVQPD